MRTIQLLAPTNALEIEGLEAYNFQEIMEKHYEIIRLASPSNEAGSHGSQAG
jgi:hypothetical protein